jgi:hypothetical protein
MRKQMIKNSIFARPYSQTNLYHGSDFPTKTKTRSGASAASVFVDCPSLMFVSSWDEVYFPGQHDTGWYTRMGSLIL